MSYDPRTDPDVRAKWQADLDAAYAAHVLKVAVCRYCRAAKTRARRALDRRGEQWATENPTEWVWQAHKADEAECKHHNSQHRLIYVTSPLSETYWAS
jgi:hypothetical protein